MIGLIAGSRFYKRASKARADSLRIAGAVMRGRFEEKSLTPAQVSPHGQSGVPKFSNFQLSHMAEKAVGESVYAYRCQTAISRAVATVPIRVRRRMPDGSVEEAPDSELAKLLNAPNERWSYATFAYNYALQMSRGGESFIVKCRATRPSFLIPASATSKGKSIPIGLWAHPSDKFNPVPGSPPEPFVKEYRVNGRAKSVAPDDMIHVLQPDPENPYRGLSPLRAGRKAIAADVAAQDWQLNSFNNRAVPTGVLTIPKRPKDTQYKETIAKFRERYASAEGARGLMVWSNKVDFTPLSQSAVENDYNASRKLNREEIVAIWGVPPQVAGIMEYSTLANYQTAMLVFWTEIILPLIGLMVSEMNRHLAPEFANVDGDVFIEPDTSNVHALFTLTKERWGLAKEQIELGVSWKIASERYGLSIPEFPGSEIGLVNSSRVPIDSFSGGSDDF